MRPAFIFALVGFGLGIALGLYTAGIGENTGKQNVVELAMNTSHTNVQIRIQSWNWPENIESPDYSELASHLRSVQCPERLIRDLLTARINRKYDALTLKNPLCKYWEDEEDTKRNNDQIASYNRERQAVLASLGLAPIKQGGTQSTQPPVADKKTELISKIKELYPLRPLPMDATPEEYGDAYTNRHARLDYLAKYLTPEELTEYRLAQDSNVSTVATLLSMIKATPDEIRRCAFAFDFTPTVINNGTFLPEAEAIMKSGLGEERFAELKAALGPENIRFVQFVMMSGITPDQVTTLQQLRQQHQDPTSLQGAASQLLGPQKAAIYFHLVGEK